MSGFAISCGRPSRRDALSMLSKIRHRGMYAQGTFEGKAIVMAQNYLEADGVSRPILARIRSASLAKAKRDASTSSG